MNFWAPVDFAPPDEEAGEEVAAALDPARDGLYWNVSLDDPLDA